MIDKRFLHPQSGFRPGRSTTEQVAALHCIIEACKTRQTSTSIVLLDFYKAFDSISRIAIARLLEQHGVPPLLIQAVTDLYTDSTAFVLTSDGPTRKFSTSSGVLQGDTLAPFLFVMTMDYVLRRALRDEDGYLVIRRRSPRHPAIHLTCLAYADDIALTCCSPDAAQRAICRIANEGERVGLHINTTKTKVLHLGTSSSPPLQLPNGGNIAACSDFKYLGVPVMNADAVVDFRKQQAWRSLHQLRTIFQSSAKDSLKIALFRSAVESVLAYGLEAVPMTASREAALDASHRRLLRSALGVRYPEILSNAELAARARVPPFSQTLRKRRQMLMGHCLRAHARGATPPLATLLLHPPQERLRRGQGRTFTLSNALAADLHLLGVTAREAATEDSDIFKRRVLASVNQRLL